MAADPSAYQHALGKSFNDLPPVLRAFAGSGVAEYEGTCTVTRGSTGFSRFVGGLMGLPRKMTNAEFTLDVDHAAHRCVWIRRFANRKKLKTTIRSGGKPGEGLMIESVGAAVLTFRVTVEDGRLVLSSLRGKFLGLPLPGFMGPKTEASVSCDGDAIHVESTVTMGRRSRLMRYTFEIQVAGLAQTAAEKRHTKPAAAPTEKVEPTLSGTPDQPQKPAAVEPTGAESQRVARPAAANARTVPISEEEQRGLKAEAAEAAPSVPADTPAAPQESESQLVARPLEADRATVPVSASKVRKIPRRDKSGDPKDQDA